ncbi:PLDc N-terminal domain-containing protein [Parasphingorhabdus cellanae]|uniref:PLDc N-terminal domain-containing protein n=1 Tax=Parasphingorhabdus cellanae TaxID=2806553 RepID=A0ABX7T8V4_9SPHN|nr:PLDc N-terminal domain-containing protein [Parasphingorhabdus cellanae]QTD57378.1 PLDc N-terminal domain-containing protein [Parasphingorhabdus cellanae]
MSYGIVGLIILALDIWALLGVWGSGASVGTKVIWSAIIIILPVIGLLLWFFVGPKGSVAA